MTARKVGGGRGAKVIIGYVRVSTDQQGRDGGSLENQETAIRAMAAKLQLPVVIYQDVGSAAGKRSIDDRKGLQEALKACRDLDGLLVVWDWSRLSRHAEAEEVIRRLLPETDRIRSINEGETFEEALKQARFVKAQKDREFLSQGTRDGMARRKSAGTIFGNPNIKEVQASGAKSMSRKADALVMKIVQILRDVPDRSKLRRQDIVNLLNDRGLRTGHGEPWTRSRVRTPLGKAEAVLDAEDQADRERMKSDPDFGRF